MTVGELIELLEAYDLDVSVKVCRTDTHITEAGTDLSDTTYVNIEEVNDVDGVPHIEPERT
jgi:sigma54-dependent transcription regulator